jgi:acyl phosphate:glycerol-3-phosphate acyltransferase
MEQILSFTSLFFCAYLAGSINFSIIIFKVTGKNDPRNSFSGNAGTTNVYRQAGIFWAVLVLILDVGRALAVAGLSSVFLHKEFVPWMGLSLVLGNRFPCFHGFQGGKGVAGYLGFTAFLSSISAALSALIWVVCYGIFRITFVASFFMVLTLAAGTAYAINFNPAGLPGIIITVLIIFYNHKKNIFEFLQKKNSSR